jgi:hypothetical protein
VTCPWPGIVKLFPARESLVSDFPARTGKSLTFFTVQHVQYRQDLAFTLHRENKDQEKGKTGDVIAAWKEGLIRRQHKKRRTLVNVTYIQIQDIFS